MSIEVVRIVCPSNNGCLGLGERKPSEDEVAVLQST